MIVLKLNINVHVAMVINVEVMVISATSVRVSWDNLNLTGITGYIVYYVINENSETGESITVSSSSSSTIITKLTNGVEYKFQVAATAGNGNIGERSSSVCKVVTLPGKIRVNSYSSHYITPKS